MTQKSFRMILKPSSAMNDGKRLSDASSLELSAAKKTKLALQDSSSAKPSNSSVDCNKENQNYLEDLIKQQSKKTTALSPNIGLTWFEALQEEFKQPYFLMLSAFIERERQTTTVYPPIRDVYTWTRCCGIKDVKVVILGQDPYDEAGQAHGLAFSVPAGSNIPPSLVNIYKELSNDIPGFKIPSHGCLKGWAVQGVLLLNTCLTVKAHCPNSHNNIGWERLTDAAIKWLNDKLFNVVFLLWGAFAQNKAAKIDKKKHLVLMAPHPSPLSASHGFFGCHHFSAANEYLIKHNKGAVDWCDLPDE